MNITLYVRKIINSNGYELYTVELKKLVGGFTNLELHSIISCLSNVKFRDSHLNFIKIGNSSAYVPDHSVNKLGLINNNNTVIYSEVIDKVNSLNNRTLLLDFIQCPIEPNERNNIIPFTSNYRGAGQSVENQNNSVILSSNNNNISKNLTGNNNLLDRNSKRVRSSTPNDITVTEHNSLSRGLKRMRTFYSNDITAFTLSINQINLVIPCSSRDIIDTTSGINQTNSNILSSSVYLKSLVNNMISKSNRLYCSSIPGYGDSFDKVVPYNAGDYIQQSISETYDPFIWSFGYYI